MQQSKDPDLLVGFETHDDAAVYRIAPDVAVVSTVDYITPPVDDPYWFGQIAAANSLSDVYAMGGRPLTALNLVMFPSKKLDMEILKEILRGGNDKVIEAGCSLVGGHSVDDNEPKYGLSVTGLIHPERIITNCNAEDGDHLILTRPIGTGVLFNACRSKKLPYTALERLLPQIASLNKTAIEIAMQFDIHACTDVTGYGIIGHSLEIAKGSCMELSINYRSLPFYPDALRMYKKGETTGSNKANRKLSKGCLKIEMSLTGNEEEMLFDPQTSGGLLLSLPASQSEELLMKLKNEGLEDAALIGEVVKSNQPVVKVK